MKTSYQGDDYKGRCRVLFVVPTLANGGAERAVSIYLRHLDRSRFEPGLCLWREEFTYEIPEDVPVWIMGKTRPWHATRTVWRMARLIKKWQPDVVFSLLSYVNLLTGVSLKMSRGNARWIPSVRNDPLKPNSRMNNRLWTRMSKTWDMIGALSNGIADSLTLHFGVPSARIATLYNPVDFELIDASLQQNPIAPFASSTVITMGRLVEQKDQKTLLQTMAIVAKTHPVRLLILGDGPLRPELQKLAVQLGIADLVEFRGFVKEPFPQVAAADVFVLSSRWEGFGNVLVEAMACETAVVSTDCPYGPSEIIENDKSGLLASVGDPESLADAITRLLDSPQLRASMASTGSWRVRTLFSVEKRVGALENLFISLTEE